MLHLPMMYPTSSAGAYPHQHASVSPSPPDLPSERKMKKPLMERRRRERINQSLGQLKEILMISSPHANSKLEKADILEMTVHYVKKHHKSQSVGGAPSSEDAAAIFNRGVQQGYSEACRAVFSFLCTQMPHQNSPQAQQFHLALVNHLRSCTPGSSSGGGAQIPGKFQFPSSVPPKFSPLSPESMSSGSPDRSFSPTQCSDGCRTSASSGSESALNRQPCGASTTPLTSQPQRAMRGRKRQQVWQPWN